MGTRPLTGARPPTGNPGSATVWVTNLDSLKNIIYVNILGTQAWTFHRWIN